MVGFNVDELVGTPGGGPTPHAHPKQPQFLDVGRKINIAGVVGERGSVLADTSMVKISTFLETVH